MKMKALFTHCFSVTCSHTLAQPDLPQEQIEAFYAACGKIHGHLYQLEVTHDFSEHKQGEAYSFFLEAKKDIEDHFDKHVSGKNLNELFGNTAGEALAPAFFRIIKEKDFGRSVVQIALQETAKNRFVTTTLPLSQT